MLSTSIGQAGRPSLNEEKTTGEECSHGVHRLWQHHEANEGWPGDERR